METLKKKPSLRPNSNGSGKKRTGSVITGRFMSQRSIIKTSKKDSGRYLVAIYDMLSEIVKEKGNYSDINEL